jgi:putative cardiolipin synthase
VPSELLSPVDAAGRHAGGTVRSRLRRLAAGLAVLLGLAGCAGLPEQVQRVPSRALPAATDTALGRIAKDSSFDAEHSGFRLMPTGQFALQARLELARRAERTLDVQYYQIHDDATGRYLFRTLRDAALRGVRVRLLLDDLYTAGEDPVLLGLNAYPNVEVRLFNPFPTGRQSLLTRFAANVGEFKRVNRRMHNKLFVADGVMAVAGGRNIADEYFMVSAGANFVDLDLLVIGAILPRLSALFDEYWNSRHVYPLTSIVASDQSPQALQQQFEDLTAWAILPVTPDPELPGEAWVQAGSGATAVKVPLPEPEPPPPNDVLGYSPVVNELNSGKLGMIWANARAYADSPDKAGGRVSTYATVPIDDVDSVRYNVIEMVRRARSEVVITSPYLIPGVEGIETFTAAVQRYGVKFTLVTNSLAATDEPVVHTGYRRYRPEMLKLGMNLYELSPVRVSRSLRLGRFSTSIGRLHAKSAVVDGERVFIGSMNFDPRSDQHNTEMGLFIESPTLAQQVLKLIDVIKSQGAYNVRLAPNGTDLQWVITGAGGKEELVEEPETDVWTRIMLEILSVIAPEDLL